MIKVFALIAALVSIVSAQSMVWVDGYTTSSGTYVAGHYRSAPNSSTYDNYGSYYNGNSSSRSSSSSSSYGTSSYDNDYSSSSSSGSGSTYVNGYYRSNGTYVNGYYRKR